MSDLREYRTSEVAQRAGVPVHVIRKWKMRGFLKLAPIPNPNAGRHNESWWTEAALAEAVQFAAGRVQNRKRPA